MENNGWGVKEASLNRHVNKLRVRSMAIDAEITPGG